MTTTDFKLLGRTELLEMLLVRTKEVERLQALLDEATARPEALGGAGSLASAALQVNGVFDAAQGAADQYLESVRTMAGRQEQACARMEAEACARAEQMIEEARRHCEELENATVVRCVEMVQTAKAESDACWNEVAGKITQLVELHAGLREILQIPVTAPGSAGPAV